MKKNEENYDLPDGWTWTTIEKIAVLSSGGTPDRRNRSYYNGNIPWVKSGELNFNIITDTEEKITSLALEKSSAKILPAGTLLIALYGTTVGKLAFLGIEAATNQAVASITTTQSFNKKYFYYYLICNREKLLKKRIGGAQPNISQKILYEFPIPIAPLIEQEKIVFKIDELFSCIEKTKEQLLEVLAQIKVYKHSILKNAYEGQLTKNWFSRKYKNENENNLPSGWYWIALSEIVSHKPKRIKPSSDSKLKFIGLDSIESNTLYPSTIHHFLNYKSSAISFTKDQVLYGRMRPYLNKVWKADFEGACSGEFLVLQCDSKILPDYLKYKLHSMDFVAFASERASGDRPRVSYDKISDYQIPLCSIEEQVEIVRMIDHHFSHVDKINSWGMESLKRLKILEKTILKQAFEGKLSQKNHQNESADILLEKIKEEIDELLSMNVAKKKNTLKFTIMTDKPKTILELLQEGGTKIPSSQLWLNSDKKDDIDGFYTELKKYVEEGKIIELPRKGKESFLKLVDKK